MNTELVKRLALLTLEFFKFRVNRFGGPVLDVACGAGRLLIPSRETGVEVDGADISRDMLEQCRRRLEV